MNGTVTVEFVGKHERRFRPKYPGCVDSLITRCTETFKMEFALNIYGQIAGNTGLGHWITFDKHTYSETIRTKYQSESMSFFKDVYYDGQFRSAKFILNDKRIDALGGRIPADVARRVACILNPF